MGEQIAQDYVVVVKLLFRSKSSRAVQEIAGGPVKRWLADTVCREQSAHNKRYPRQRVAGDLEYQGRSDR
jgi:hypothetical protein